MQYKLFWVSQIAHTTPNLQDVDDVPEWGFELLFMIFGHGCLPFSGKGAEGLTWGKISRALHLSEDVFPDACHMPQPDTF